MNDRFNRITDQRWQDDVTGTPTDIDRYQYGYDRNSNRTWKRNTVGSALDEFYTYDRLNRLNQMQRGTLTGTPPTGIAGTPTKEQDWTLDPVGNWSAFVTRTAGTTDLNQTRTSNQVNEITAIGGTPAWATPPAYDAAGNMTSFPQQATPTNAFGATYDAWNRLTKVTDGANTVAEYVYDGLGRRIVKKTYTSGTLTETRHIYWNIGWQAIEERVGTSTTADKQYVWGVRYVDELVCRDDPTPQRLYACQDANFNLTAIVDAVGVVVERSNYTPYGVISYLAPNWSPRAVSSYGWVIGFQGLLYDPETGNWYQRVRYSNPLLGSFQQREHRGGDYVDGFNLYQFLISNPLIFLDPSGCYIRSKFVEGKFKKVVERFMKNENKDFDALFKSLMLQSQLESERSISCGCSRDFAAISKVLFDMFNDKTSKSPTAHAGFWKDFFPSKGLEGDGSELSHFFGGAAYYPNGVLAQEYAEHALRAPFFPDIEGMKDTIRDTASAYLGNEFSSMVRGMGYKCDCIRGKFADGSVKFSDLFGDDRQQVGPELLNLPGRSGIAIWINARKNSWQELFSDCKRK